MLCGICTVQIQSRKYVLDHADYTPATQQHELLVLQVRSPPALKVLEHDVEIDGRSDVGNDVNVSFLFCLVFGLFRFAEVVCFGVVRA